MPERGYFEKIYNDISGIVGEPGRIRTFDPLIKSQLLYHLSYGPHATNWYTSNHF